MVDFAWSRVVQSIIVSRYTGCVNKKQSPRKKNYVFQPWEYWFEPNFQTLYVSIQKTYPANFIEKKLIWFNRYSSLNFKVHFFQWTYDCTLNTHGWLINFCRAFHQQLKCFNDEYQMPIAHTVFKQSVLNIVAQQLQQPMIEFCCKKMIQLPY